MRLIGRPEREGSSVTNGPPGGIASTRPALIRVCGVAKSYASREGVVESLKPLDFDIRDGEFVSVVGPSGCGKSTLLKLIAGLLPVSAGSIEIEGTPVDGPAPNIGIVF